LIVYFIRFSSIYLSLPEIPAAAFITTLAGDPNYAEAFGTAGYGGFVGQELLAIGGFGKFLLVIMALSVVE
jgi:hypothetical protein